MRDDHSLTRPGGMRALTRLGALACLLAGCTAASGESADPADVRPDTQVDGAAPAPDAGPMLDARSGTPDAEPLSDTAPSPDPDAGSPPDAGPDPDPSPPGWRLVWSDEFDASAGTPPDPMWWRHDVGGDGWGNGQLEFDTDRPLNAAHDGRGHLAITAREEEFGGRAYTSARIKTQGRFSQTYGRFEARMQLPTGQGIWPAFWLLGERISEVGWPACGEIDVMEFRGQTPLESTGALHGPGYSAGESLGAARQAPAPLPDDFHMYAVEWDPDVIEWSVDGEVFHRVTPADLPPGAPWVYDDPFFIILNVAVGGGFVGPPDETTVFPQTLLVDHVRVYERLDPPVPPEPEPEPDDALPLPMVVDAHYVPSGYMGDGARGGIEPTNCPIRGRGEAVGRCHGFNWIPGAEGWGGVWWQSPEGNWGDLPGQPIAAGAAVFTFLAWSPDGARVRFMAGYEGPDGFTVSSDAIALQPVPTRYTVSLRDVTYDEVAGGFGWVIEQGRPRTLFVDDIRWR